MFKHIYTISVCYIYHIYFIPKADKLSFNLSPKQPNFPLLINNLQGILKETRKKCRQVKCENERMNEERHCPAYDAPLPLPHSPQSTLYPFVPLTNIWQSGAWKNHWDAAGCGMCVWVECGMQWASGACVCLLVCVEYAFICTVKYVASVEKSTAKSAKEKKQLKRKGEEKSREKKSRVEERRGAAKSQENIKLTKQRCSLKYAMFIFFAFSVCVCVCVWVCFLFSFFFELFYFFGIAQQSSYFLISSSK